MCDNEDAISLLTENTGTEAVRGFSLSLSVPNSHSNQLREVNYSERRWLNFSFWKSANDSPTFSMEAFAKMRHLQLLKLSNVELTGNYKDIPRTLVWLHWHGFSLTNIPNDLCLEKLIVLEMPYSKLRSVWKGLVLLKLLKVLDMRYSAELTRTPNFKGLPGLQILVLEGCINLKEVDKSIGVLVKLESLNLRDCKNIHVKLPVLKSLEELDISGCPSLGDLPEVLMKFESLKVLKAGGIMIKDFREAKLSWMQSALLLWQLPQSTAQSNCFRWDFFPRTLTQLDLADCGLSDNRFDVDLSCMPLLKELDLSQNPITCLPESINQLQLDFLMLDGCLELRSVSVVGIPAVICTHCPNLVEHGGYFKVTSLRRIDIEVKKRLGLENDTVLTASTDQIEMFNKLTWVSYRSRFQVSREYGMDSVFLPGGHEVPDWFHQMRGEGDCISFHLSPVVGHKLIGFSLCIKYWYDSQQILSRVRAFEILDFGLVISNETTGERFDYKPVVHSFPRLGKDMLWLSYWRLEELGDLIPLGEGDQLKLTLFPSTYVAKEWGIRLIYQEEEEECIVIEPMPHRHYLDMVAVLRSHASSSIDFPALKSLCNVI